MSLVKRIVTVSVETVAIIAALPPLNFAGKIGGGDGDSDGDDSDSQ